MNYITTRHDIPLRVNRNCDINDVDCEDYLMNRWREPGNSNKINICFLKVVYRTPKFITITEKDKFIRLSWDKENAVWGTKQGYHCRFYIKANQLPEGLETLY